MMKSIVALRRLRGKFRADVRTIKTPEDLDALIDELQSDLDGLRSKPAANWKMRAPKAAPEVGQTRMELGGESREQD